MNAVTAAVALGMLLAACSPIEAYRSLSGASKNDPDPATAPFAGNLAGADASPYPNLASVPPPPSRATSAAERQKLTQALIADRAAAAAQAGPPAVVPAPAQSGTRPAAAVTPPPAPPQPPGVLPPAAVPASPASGNTAQASRRGSREPLDHPPTDSSLQMPQVRAVPEPDAPRPALPPPRLATIPAPPIAAAPLPAAVASAAPQAAPAPPVLAPPAPPPVPARAEPSRPPAATTVAAFDRLDRAQIERVAALYREQPAPHPPGPAVRVIAHAAAPAPGADPLAGYHAALERGQAVAKALAEAGIPVGRIQTEATPAAASAAGRIEIQFLP